MGHASDFDRHQAMLLLDKLEQVPYLERYTRLIQSEGWKFLRVKSKYLQYELSIEVFLWHPQIYLAYPRV